MSPLPKKHLSFIYKCCKSLYYVCFQKCLRLDLEAPVWVCKQRVLVTLTQSLTDVLNYGLYLPAFNGRAGKFLDEERLLREYPLPTVTPVPYLEVHIHADVELSLNTLLPHVACVTIIYLLIHLCDFSSVTRGVFTLRAM